MLCVLSTVLGITSFIHKHNIQHAFNIYKLKKVFKYDVCLCFLGKISIYMYTMSVCITPTNRLNIKGKPTVVGRFRFTRGHDQ